MRFENFFEKFILFQLKFSFKKYFVHLKKIFFIVVFVFLELPNFLGNFFKHKSNIFMCFFVIKSGATKSVTFVN